MKSIFDITPANLKHTERCPSCRPDGINLPFKYGQLLTKAMRNYKPNASP